VSLPTISPLRGLVEVTRLLRAREDLPALLDAVARTIGESLGYRTVAINLYRPAWDDFEVTTVYGNEDARATLLGNARPGDDWTVLLAERFERRGAYVVPSGSVDWDSLGPSYVPEGESTTDPDAWDPEDALFVALRDQHGNLLGILSVDEPVSGRRPTDDELDVLVSLADHGAIALEAAREAAASARHQRALEELLAVSSRITGETSNAEILRRVCTGIRDALDFQNVCAALVDPQNGAVVPQAAAGWHLEELRQRGLVTVAQIEPLLDDEFLTEGCYLLTHEEARMRLAGDVDVYPSQLNGRGPWAWNRHWLIVPLRDGHGALLGIIWVDNPCDRLVPSRCSDRSPRCCSWGRSGPPRRPGSSSATSTTPSSLPRSARAVAPSSLGTGGSSSGGPLPTYPTRSHQPPARRRSWTGRSAVRGTTDGCWPGTGR
jgi:GAF domain-containing protein